MTITDDAGADVDLGVRRQRGRQGSHFLGSMAHEQNLSFGKGGHRRITFQ